MRNGITVDTVHFAHIDISPVNASEELDLCSEVDKQTKKFIAEYCNKEKADSGSVQINDDFCCNCLTEIGLKGTSLEAVKTIANKIAEWSEAHPKLELLG